MDQLYTIIVKPQQYAVAVAVIAAGVDMLKQFAPAFLVVAAGADQVHKGVGAAVMQEGVVIVEEYGVVPEIHVHEVFRFPGQPNLFILSLVGQAVVRVLEVLLLEGIHEGTKVLQVDPGQVVHAVHEAQRQLVRIFHAAQVGLDLIPEYLVFARAGGFHSFGGVGR